MARYIDVDKFEDYVYDCAIRNVRVDCDRNCVECYCNNGGIEDVEPVIHAKWETKPEPYNSLHDCSHCGETHIKSNYCPNCNAKMDKE